VALATYVRTTCPTVFGFDSAEFATGAYTLGLVHSPGYPLYTLLAKCFALFPAGEVAYRVNLMSAVFGGLSVAALYACLFLLVRSRLAALAGALAFAFGHTYWEQAVVAEVYTLQMFLLASAFAFLLKWERDGKRSSLLGAAALLGAALANHTSAALLLPGALYLVCVKTRRARMPAADYIVVAACLVAPLTLYAYIPLRDAMDPAYNWPRAVGLDVRTLRGFWLHVSAISFRPSLSFSPEYGVKGGANFLLSLGRTFMWLGLPFGLAGLVWLWRRDRVMLWFSVVLFALPTVLFVNYDVFDQEVFFLTPFFVWAWWMASGVRAMLNAAERWFAGRSALLLAAALIALGPALFSLASNFPRLDLSEETALADECRATLTSLPREAWVFSSWSVAKPLEYFQIVEGLRPDIEVYDSSHSGLRELHRLRPQGSSLDEIVESAGALQREATFRALDARPVYTTYVEHALSLAFDFQRDRNLYTISPKPAPRRVATLHTGDAPQVVFDDTLILGAVAISPTTIRPVDPFRVTFITAIRRPTAKHYRLYLVVSRAASASDRAGIVVASKYEPGSLEVTTDTWDPGVFYERGYDIGLPGPVEPGEYLISAGVIDQDGPVAPTEPRGIETLAVAVGRLHVEE
jgi:hypothetical protein